MRGIDTEEAGVAGARGWTSGVECGDAQRVFADTADELDDFAEVREFEDGSGPK